MNLMNIDTALLNEATEIINGEKYIFIPSKPCINDYGIMVVYLDMINISLESIVLSVTIPVKNLIEKKTRIEVLNSYKNDLIVKFKQNKKT